MIAVMQWWRKVLFPSLLFVMVQVLLVANYSAGTFLSGWDNLQVELNLSVNIERSWQAAWQEYQGLGLLGGMAHASDLVHQIILWFMSTLLPQAWLRYFWNDLCLVLGSLGAFYLFRQLFQFKKSGVLKTEIAAFIAALFYLLNLGTVQNFVPNYDPFAAFFAFLPWGLWALFRYLHSEKNRDVLVLLIISFVGSCAFYVETIFVVYAVLVGVTLLWFLLTHFQTKDRPLGQILKSTLLILVANAFWLLPVAYFTLTSSQTTVLGKGNAMSTDVTFARNNQFGNWLDVLQLKGYWFDYTDFDQWGNTVYVLDAWKGALLQPWMQGLVCLFVGFLILGISSLFVSKNWHFPGSKWRWLLLLFLMISTFILIGDNPPTGWLYRFCLEYIPLFSQFFRASFTKWIVPMSLFYSMFVGLGFYQLTSWVKGKWHVLLGAVMALLIVLYSWPSFQGNFFYSRLRVKIPQAYFQTFDFFKKVDQNVRIANLPQHSFYGWQWNSWGYRGSGFLWYGIKQPILDRAFDVWSTADENYYWQLQTALDAQDMAAFERVLAKYDVSYLLLDESVVNRNTNKPFDYQAWEEFLAQSERIQPVATFDFLKIYQFSEPEQAQTQAFVSLWSALPKVAQQANFTWQDQAYQDLADYQEVNLDQAEQLYPFASLFSNHSQAELPFQLSETDEYFVLTSFLANQEILAANWQPEASELLATEKFFPVHLQWQTVGEQSFFTLEAISPILRFADRQLTWQWQKSLELSSQSCLATKDCVLELNGQTLADFSAAGEQTVLLRSQQQNSLALKQKAQSNYYDYLFIDMSNQHFRQLEQQLPEAVSGITLLLPKESFGNLGQNLLETPLNQNTAKNCRQTAGSFYKETTVEGNLYTASNANSCDSFYLAELAHNQGWLLRTESQHLSGLPMTFAVQVDSLGRSPLETYLPKTAALETSYFFLPPVENFGQGYSFYVASDAYGRLATQNRLASFAVYYWPYRFTQALRFSRAEVSSAQTLTCQFKAEKKALWWYQVDLADCWGQAKLLKLSQAYDSGWLAVSKVDGQWSYLSHEKFSAWSNAWQLTGTEERVYLFFWPQLLEYLGFIFLIIGVPAMFFFSAKRHGSFQKAER